MKKKIVVIKPPESNWYTKTLVDYLCLNYNEWLAFIFMFYRPQSIKSEEQLIAHIKSGLIDYFFTRGIDSGYFDIDEVDAIDWDAIATYLITVNPSFWEKLIRYQ